MLLPAGTPGGERAAGVEGRFCFSGSSAEEESRRTGLLAAGACATDAGGQASLGWGLCPWPPAVQGLWEPGVLDPFGAEAPSAFARWAFWVYSLED